MSDKESQKFQTMLDLVINTAGNSPVCNSILLINVPGNNYKFVQASGCLYPSGQKVTADYNFRIASITKTFTATIVLQLMEEGLLRLDDKFINFIDKSKMQFLKNIHFIEELNFTSFIAVHHLLQHTSGLRDYFNDDKRFVDCVRENPSCQWNATSILNKYFEYGLNKKALFKPGMGFYYSDTNYILLALLIEELTGKRLHEAFEERIYKPLKLNNTYLEFYQQPKGQSLRTFPFQGNVSLEEVNTSFDWGGGGMVSTVNDLDIFIRSLVKGELFKVKGTVETMKNFHSSDITKLEGRLRDYGLGLQKKEIRERLFIGHTGVYGVMMYCDIINEATIILTINQAAGMQKAEWLIRKVVENLKTF